ncbi:TPA: hypothetical protein DIU27_03170 [Candidatus Collierbacteria bacterium]|uniref:Nicotinamidase n=1 Tax=Candidatus Collierbacteria bacterium GW2011_GWB2_44_22 TaxID=1618387 RepID=A0A0G1HWP9_9BACT|nr:MAG: hypothetical protein UW31_C0006G0079 [Candidatus Collierbacteria bacterium GW2011_GWA2_44_13]KKT48458.1 MAG: hypothetical protein UW42_C0057G0003 [Candidatus Collierbacteria bacterium GW2011_GWB1_44_197]KKT51360.1 MAG: hypothetical protein UW44_C0013G0080 [Candidatus Collierbacteria bacterium GW2011_GWB2_44_22]KKT67957.1 MAG: hypothetical protein UW64_C0033G0002 [Microgenomates group bacterium GW2011_GWC1_44_37]KKT88397.1 MAG: hypothetical protein UW88_C0011G0037 [Candidatus Collierbact
MTPSLYKASDIGKIYKPRPEFATLGMNNRTPKTAFEDKRKVGVLFVDGENDFINLDGGLPVPGAIEDSQRFLENFFYPNFGDITSVYASMDDHPLFSIFFYTWWRNRHGEAPGNNDFTAITYADIKSGAWKPIIDPLWSTEYVKKLEAQAKKPLMIWPLHCLQGTPGQALIPALSEALLYHSAARGSQLTRISKGMNPRTEHYGIFKAEIEDPKDVSTQLNTAVLDAIAKHDLIYVAGQAKSHCVLETMTQLVEYFGKTQPETIKKIRFLMDCTSSVKHPAIDFESIANIALDKMVQKGVVLVNSTDPIR